MKNDEWLTPPEILQALGPFDLDPCAPVERPWPMAAEHFTVEDNGLAREWSGRVWCNPPYGRESAAWLDRLASHGDGIALIFARTETDMFFRHVWERADAVLFIRGRLHFHYVDGRRAAANGGAPSCLVAYGKRNVEALDSSGLGHLVRLAQQPAADPFEREYRAARAAGMGFEDAWHAAIKTEQQPAAVDDAMVLVPREPTPAILEAFSRMDDWLKTAEGYRYLVQAAVDGARGEPYWKAMIEAAQPGGSDNGR